MAYSESRCSGSQTQAKMFLALVVFQAALTGDLETDTDSLD